MPGPYDAIYGLRPDLDTLGEPDPIQPFDPIEFLGRTQATAYNPEQAQMALASQEQAMPDDFFARIAQQSGAHPFNFRPRQKPTGLEVLLSLAAGFGNARAAGGARRVAETQDRNQQAREAAKTLATWRHQERLKDREVGGRKEALATNEQYRRDKMAMDAADAALRRGDQQEWRRIMADIYRDRIDTQRAIGGVGGLGGAAGPDGGPPPKPRPAAASEIDHMTMDSALLSQIGRVKQQYNPKFLGPYSGKESGLRVAGLLPGKGGKARPGEAKFRSSLSGIRNWLLKLRSGAAVTEPEYRRLKDELPNEDLPSESFVDRMDQFEQSYREIAERRRANLAALGVNMSRVQALPGMTVWSGAVTSPAPVPQPGGMSDDQAYQEYLKVSGGKP